MKFPHKERKPKKTWRRSVEKEENRWDLSRLLRKIKQDGVATLIPFASVREKGNKSKVSNRNKTLFKGGLR